LNPGGHVLLDVYSSAAFEQRKETAGYELSPRDGFWSPHRYYEFSNTFKYEQEQLILDKYTIVEADRVRTIYNWLQCFDPDGIKREFTSCGFEVVALYADVAGAVFDPSAPEFAIVARKP
jgi:hypothetical protein